MIGVAAEPVTRRQGGARDAGESPRGARPWAAPRNNPRIVRVPRGAGGKDRHSKVATVRGLRDRRVRLSVPTAVQLYDLQDRLGLCQPSKVVDWLLDAARHAIDKLPPLPPLPCHTPHASFPPAGGCDAAGAGRTATGFEHQELELEDAPYCHVMERSSGVSFAAYSHWDPPGGYLLPPEAACSTAPVFAPAFDHSKVHYAYSYLDGAPRGFRASTRD